MDMYTLLYLKCITDKDCVAPGILLHVMWQPGWEGSLGDNGYCIFMAESLHCSLETITTLFVNRPYPSTK